MEGTAKGGAAGVEVEVEVEEAPRFRRVCVFCGSSFGKRSSYREAAVELGKELVTHIHETITMRSSSTVDQVSICMGSLSKRAVGWLVDQVARRMDLVYGGGSLGLMGQVSEAVHSAGGHVIGSVLRTHAACIIANRYMDPFHLLTVAILFCRQQNLI